MTDLAIGRVSPFGHPGITARLQLPQAYRSLPRPSSPLDAKASTVCLIAFDLKFDPCALASLRWCVRIPYGRPRVAIRRTVLIPHTLISRLPERSIIHPSIVKELVRSQPAIAGEGSGSDKRSKRELAARECGRLPRLFHPPARRPALTRDLQKGGDPAAGSPTATLLRLRPSH